MGGKAIKIVIMMQKGQNVTIFSTLYASYSVNNQQ